MKAVINTLKSSQNIFGYSIYVRTQIKHLYLTLLLISLFGCAQNNEAYFSGRIDSDMYAEIENSKITDAQISFNSYGGDVESGLLIGEYFQNNNISVVFEGECISSCAEFVLAGAKSVKFKGKPIVGFHWSPIMDFNHYREKILDLTDCDFSFSDRQLKLWSNSMLSENFWQDVEARLDLLNISFRKKDGHCPWKSRVFKNDLWLPSSDQLSKLLGLNFTGNVCADDFDKCKVRMSKRMKNGYRVIIGDKLYIVGEN